MTYDVLTALRRRLVALDRTARPERRTTATPVDAPDSPAPLVADGGGAADGDDDAHLRDLPDGAGCVEIWEYLSNGDDGQHRAEDGPSRECRADD